MTNVVKHRFSFLKNDSERTIQPLLKKVVKLKIGLRIKVRGSGRGLLKKRNCIRFGVHPQHKERLLTRLGTDEISGSEQLERPPFHTYPPKYSRK